MKKVTVIGAGTMGNGIAHVFAQTGFPVNLVDVSEKSLEKGMATLSKNLDRMLAKETISESDKTETLQRIATFTSLGEGVQDTDLEVEAATENLPVKLNIFGELDTLCPPHTILATNTSSISITQIAAVTQRPEQVIGMHFMNPVPIMKLVEIIRGYSTSDKVTETIMELSRQLGKTPTEVNDYPGFVATRILMPMINEAIANPRSALRGIQKPKVRTMSLIG